MKGLRSCLPERRKTLGPGMGLTGFTGDHEKILHRSPAPAWSALREDPAAGRGRRWSLSWGGQRRSRGAACVCVGLGDGERCFAGCAFRPGFLCLSRAQLELSPRFLMENDGAVSCTVFLRMRTHRCKASSFPITEKSTRKAIQHSKLTAKSLLCCSYCLSGISLTSLVSLSIANVSKWNL